jgi:sugar lactone lactonase YvrE
MGSLAMLNQTRVSMMSAIRFVPGGQLLPRIHLNLRSLILAGLLLPSAALAQVSYTGTTATQNFGSQAIGSPSAGRTFSFSIAAGTTVGSIAVVTQGAPNLDFTSAVGGTCAAQTYASATTCTVNATFKPKFAGVRMGAVVFFSAPGNTGTVLGSAPAYGIGTGAQLAYGPGTVSVIAPVVQGEALYYPWGVAVDAGGDLFIADAVNKRVVKMPAGGGAALVINATVDGVGLSNPEGLAVDGAGDLFIADGKRVVKVPPAGGIPTAIGPTISPNATIKYAAAVAVDGAGDLFIADEEGPIFEVPANGGSPTYFAPEVNHIQLIDPSGVAVDGAGDLFIGDQSNHRVVEIPFGGGTPIAIDPTVNGESLLAPSSVAVDAAGDLFIEDSEREQVVEVPAGGGPATAIHPIVNGAGLNVASGMALNAGGDLFIADTSNNRVIEVQRSQPLAVNFPTVTHVGTADTADGTQTVQIQNVGDAALTVTALNYPAEFPEASGDVSACTGSTSLSPGQECDLPIDFAPEEVGTQTGNVTLTDNALDVAGAEQSISVTGIGLAAGVATQISYTGTVANAQFGSEAIGSASGSQTFSFSIAAGTTIGSIGVVTTGIPHLDFDSGAGTTCAAQVYPSATTCTVEVTFAPRGIGLRMGAVVFFSGANNTGRVIASVPVDGIGTGPQIEFYPSASISITPTIGGEPNSIAVDAAGDLFYTAFSGYSVAEIPAGSTTAYPIDVTADGIEFSEPTGIAVDGAGNLFVAEPQSNRVVEVPAGGGAPTAIGPTGNGFTLDGCKGVAVDGLGDLFIADSNHDRILTIPANGGAVTSFDNRGYGTLLEPSAVAVDGAGNLFISDTGNNRVLEELAAGGPAITISGGGGGIAVDGAGDVFIAGGGTGGTVFELQAGTNGGFDIGPVGGASGIAVDGAGDLFIAYPYPASVIVEQFLSQPPALNFYTTTPEGSIDTTDGTQTVRVSNAGNEALNLTALNYPADFSPGAGTSLCPSATSLSVGQWCNVPVEFTPEHPGVLSEGVTLTDNSLNVTGAQQSIGLSGKAFGPAALTSPAPGSTLSGSSATFTWTTGEGATSYSLYLGTAVGSSNLYSSGSTTATSVTVSNLPAHGATLYARLFSIVEGAGQYQDYTYTEATAVLAALSSPAPSSTLAGSSATFTWTAGVGATGYQLWLGVSGPGSSDIYASGVTTATSAMATNLPAKGATLYARLFARINGVWQFTDYTYTEATGALPSLTTPAPSSTLGGAAATFSWTTGVGATNYQLWLGTSGAGSSNVFASGVTTATSAMATKLPAKGATLYARLFAQINGVWQFTDYSYTEATGALPALTTPAPSSTLSGSTVTFTWTPGTGATNYNLWLGVSGAGSSDVYNSGVTTATSAIASNLPAKGTTLYARLFAQINGAWQFTDYTYTEAIGATPALITPAPSSTLSGSTVTFTWTPGIGVTSYNLWLGVSGVGSSDVYTSGAITATSATATNLPAKGTTLYARLSAKINGVWHFNDYVYTEATAVLAAITSPAPGSTLGTYNVPFTWTAGVGVTNYTLWVGTSGVASSNLYNSGATTSTSDAIPSIPAEGVTVYVRLYSNVGGKMESTDYTYTEQ